MISTSTPKGWRRTTVGKVADVVTGGTPSRSRPEYWNGSIPWLTTGAIDFNVIEEPSEFITENGLRNSSARLFPPGTLLMAMFGQGVTRGKVALLGIEAAFNQACSAIRLHDGHPRYLFYYLSYYYEQIRRMGQAGTQSNLNGQIIKSIPILLPSDQEQEQITQVLSTWDRAIELIEKLIEAKQRRKRGLMQQLLTGRKRFPGFGPPVTNQGELPAGWQEVRLGKVFKERKETKRPDLPLLSITGTRGVIPYDSNDRKDSSNADKSKYKRIAVGDIGYNTMRMWQGVSALSSLEGIVSPAYTICIPQQGIDPKFATYYFKFPPVINLLYRNSQGLVDDTRNLKYHHFAKIKVMLPSVVEQSAIAASLSASDDELKELQAYSEALQQQKRGLMQQLLTGRKPVILKDELEVEHGRKED